jgi:hypothetical protein
VFEWFCNLSYFLSTLWECHSFHFAGVDFYLLVFRIRLCWGWCDFNDVVLADMYAFKVFISINFATVVMGCVIYLLDIREWMVCVQMSCRNRDVLWYLFV